MPGRTNIPEEVWEYHKRFIQDLYIERDLTLKEVNRELRKRGFAASNQQYARQFRKWRVTKSLKGDEWRYISSVLQDRSLRGKPSVVFVHGQEVPMRKHYRGVHRHNRPLLLPPAAQHMSHIRVCTPISIGDDTADGCALLPWPIDSETHGLQAMRRETPSVSVVLDQLPSWEMADMLDQSFQACKRSIVRRVSSSRISTQRFQEEVIGVLRCCDASLRLLGYEGSNINLALDGLPESSPLKRLGQQSSKVEISSVEQQLTALLQVAKIIISLTANSSLVLSLDKTFEGLVESFQSVDAMDHFLLLVTNYDLYWILEMMFSLDHPTIEIFAHKFFLQAVRVGEHKMVTFLLGQSCHIDLRDSFDEAFRLATSDSCHWDIASRLVDEGAKPYSDFYAWNWAWRVGAGRTTEKDLSRGQSLLDIWVESYEDDLWDAWEDALIGLMAHDNIELCELVLQSFTRLLPLDFEGDCRMLINAAISSDQSPFLQVMTCPETWKARADQHQVLQDFFRGIRVVAALNAKTELWRGMVWLVSEAFDDSLLEALGYFDGYAGDNCFSFLLSVINEVKDHTLGVIHDWAMWYDVFDVVRLVLKQKVVRHKGTSMNREDFYLFLESEYFELSLDREMLDFVVSHTVIEDVTMMLDLLRELIQTDEYWPLEHVIRYYRNCTPSSLFQLSVDDVLKMPQFVYEVLVLGSEETLFWLLRSDPLRESLNNVLARDLVDVDQRISREFRHQPDVVEQMFAYGVSPCRGLLTLCAISCSQYKVEYMRIITNEMLSRGRPFCESDMTICLNQVLDTNRAQFRKLASKAKCHVQCLRFLGDHGATAKEPWMQFALQRDSGITDTMLWSWLNPDSSPILAAIDKSAFSVLEVLFTMEFSLDQYYKHWGCWSTPLQYVARCNKQEIVKWLRLKGADINALAHDQGGTTVLQAVAASGNLQLVLELLEAGADINAPAAKWGGRTALESAAELGKLDIVHVLIANNKDLHRLRTDCKRASRLLKVSSQHGVIARMLDKHARKLAIELGVEHEDEIDHLCKCELEREHVEYMCGRCKAKYTEAVELE